MASAPRTAASGAAVTSAPRAAAGPPPPEVRPGGGRRTAAVAAGILGVIVLGLIGWHLTRPSPAAKAAADMCRRFSASQGAEARDFLGMRVSADEDQVLKQLQSRCRPLYGAIQVVLAGEDTSAEPTSPPAGSDPATFVCDAAADSVCRLRTATYLMTLREVQPAFQSESDQGLVTMAGYVCSELADGKSKEQVGSDITDVASAANVPLTGLDAARLVESAATTYC